MMMEKIDSNLLGGFAVNSKKKQLKIILIVFFIDILIVFFCNFLNTILFNRNDIPVNNSSSFFMRYGICWGIIMIILIGPLIEEVTFRLGLSFRKKDVIISMMFLLLYISKLLIKDNYWLFIPVVIAGILLLFLFAKFTTQKFYLNIKKNRGFYILISSVLFTIIHLFSYNKIEI